MANTTITPGTGAIAATTNLAPLISIATLLLAGQQPLLNTTVFVAGTNLLNTAAPTMGLQIAPPAGGAAITAGTPVLGYGSAPTIGAGAVNFLGAAPQLVVSTVTPPSGAVSVGAAPPTVNVAGLNLMPGAPAAALTGAAPQLNGGSAPPVAALALTGLAPSLQLTIMMGPAQTGLASFSGGLSTIRITIAPPTGTLLMSTRISPLINPSGGALLLSGNAPLLGGPVPLAPPSGVLTGAGTVSPITLTVPAPPAANLVLGGNYPALTVRYQVLASSGAAALSGLPPGVVQQGTIITPAALASALVTGTPTLAWNLLSANGAVSFASAAPTSSTGTQLSVATGAMSSLGAVSALRNGLSLVPPPTTAALSLSGAAPVVMPATVPSSAAITLAGAAPGLGLTLSPPAAAATLVSDVPTVNGRTVIAAPVAALVLPGAGLRMNLGVVAGTGALAIVGQAPSAIMLAITAPSGALVVPGAAPGLQISGVPQTQTGTVTLTGGTPVLGLGIAPQIAALAGSGAVGFVNSLSTLTPLSATASYTGNAPVMNQLGVIATPSGALALIGLVPGFARIGYVAPPAGNLSMNGNTPLIYLTTQGQTAPTTGALRLSGQPVVRASLLPDAYYVVRSRGPATYSVTSPG